MTLAPERGQRLGSLKPNTRIRPSDQKRLSRLIWNIEHSIARRHGSRIPFNHCKRAHRYTPDLTGLFSPTFMVASPQKSHDIGLLAAQPPKPVPIAAFAQRPTEYAETVIPRSTQI